MLVVLLALAPVVCAQRRVDPRNTYKRVICVVPLIGQGTKDDPKRPMYAPAPAALTAAQAAAFPAASAQTGSQTPGSTSAQPAAPTAAALASLAAARRSIVAFQWVPSDDGQYAIVEFVAQDRAAFQALEADPAVLAAFEKDQGGKTAIEGAVQRYKKNFDLDTFAAVMP